VLYYVLLSSKQNHRIMIKLKIHNSTQISTISNLFLSAQWLERECWDMFGIFFFHNKDLRRILTDYGFTGHPLRKNFPVTGYIQVRYDETLKRIIIEPIHLTQDFRLFFYSNAWSLLQNF